MAFAGDEHHVAGARPGNRVPDRVPPVCDLDDLGITADFGRPSQDFAADRRGIFVTRVVVGDDHQVGQLRGYPAHRGPLARVTIAAGAEHHRQPAVRVRQGGQHRPQRFRFVRVVDQREKALAAVDLLEPPRDPDLTQARHRLFRGDPDGVQNRQGDQAIGDVVAAR
ncbi:Uncharacterised protein [Mycobacterium tuberculosis]|uniref:Uncharacterized protein n=1 Tax=Mycobacterium tuberculosis TaxID=1773 RepID=A0A655A0H0_MYCTX|nr:Uncharacterised protein [Mycobacterium tuberculosis]CFR43328.1 Uncharacterised protein [Mycobacterium tuberculosis]CKP86612.1 Uncharacterised protein [Mycobacterium tuberculosis]CKR26937.1 Uncharacterised protein [Mycobacterium tuberculosis]CKR88473.1 Uncharacterised protein [Mycobacterium tuberculosis]